MATETLEYQILAKEASFVAGIERAVQKALAFDRALEEATGGQIKFNRATKEYIDASGNVVSRLQVKQVAYEQAARGADKMTEANRRSRLGIVELSRGISDFVASGGQISSIVNNVEQLAFVAGVSGPAVLGITALGVAAQLLGPALFNAFDGGEKEAKELTEAVSKIRDEVRHATLELSHMGGAAQFGRFQQARAEEERASSDILKKAQELSRVNTGILAIREEYSRILKEDGLTEAQGFLATKDLAGLEKRRLEIGQEVALLGSEELLQAQHTQKILQDNTDNRAFQIQQLQEQFDLVDGVKGKEADARRIHEEINRLTDEGLRIIGETTGAEKEANKERREAERLERLRLKNLKEWQAAQHARVRSEIEAFQEEAEAMNLRDEGERDAAQSRRDAVREMFVDLFNLEQKQAEVEGNLNKANTEQAEADEKLAQQRQENLQQYLEGIAMQVEGTEDYINAIRDAIKALLAQAVATAILGEISKRGPLGILTGTIVAGGVAALFESVVPKVGDSGDGSSRFAAPSVGGAPGFSVGGEAAGAVQRIEIAPVSITLEGEQLRVLLDRVDHRRRVVGRG